ncbi:MAG: hypoxanthine phosphoribosyltransferase, partial [Lactococcus garvieae]
MLEKDIKKVLISEEEIQSKTIELGKILADEYKDKNPLLLGILRGSVPFLAELVKRMD